MLVCVADPSATFRRRLRNVVTGAGHRCVEAADSAGLSRRLRNYPVEVVLLSDDLGDASGPEAVRALRAEPSHAATPVLLFGSGASHEAVLEAVESGVTHYVVRPFDDEVVAVKLRAAAEAVERRTRRDPGYSRTDIL